MVMALEPSIIAFFASSSGSNNLTEVLISLADKVDFFFVLANLEASSEIRSNKSVIREFMMDIEFWEIPVSL